MEKAQAGKTGTENECLSMTNRSVSGGIVYRARLVLQEQRILVLTFQDWEGPEMRDQRLEERPKQVLDPYLSLIPLAQLKRKNPRFRNGHLH